MDPDTAARQIMRGIAPDPGRALRGGHHVEGDGVEQGRDRGTVSRAILAVDANAAGHAAFGRRAAEADVVAEQVVARTQAAVVVQPEEVAQRPERGREAGDVGTTMAEQRVHHQQAIGDAGLVERRDGRDDFVAEGEAADRAIECELQRQGFAVLACEEEAGDDGGEVEIGDPVAVELGLLVGNEDLHAAGGVDVAVMAERDHEAPLADAGSADHGGDALNIQGHRCGRRVVPGRARGRRCRRLGQGPTCTAGPLRRTALVMAEAQIMQQRVDPGGADVLVGAEIVARVEIRVGRAALFPADGMIVGHRIARRFWIVPKSGEVEAGIDMRRNQCERMGRRGRNCRSRNCRCRTKRRRQEREARIHWLQSRVTQCRSAWPFRRVRVCWMG